MGILRKITHGYNLLLYGMTDRYGHLSREIQRGKCRTLMEIGVWNGEHSCLMIRSALRQHPPQEISFFGFDLFETMDQPTLQKEASKSPVSLDTVRAKLAPFDALGVTINLYPGDTNCTLPKIIQQLPPMDFIFIDGGHSYETVSHDWANTKQLMHPSSIVIFDDYTNPKAVEQLGYGVRRLMDNLDRNLYTIDILKPADRFWKNWGVLQTAFARVTVNRS